MPRKPPPRIHVTDYEGLAQFCHAQGWQLDLCVDDGLWTLKIRDDRRVISKDSIRGEVPDVFDQLALDAAITLGRSGKFG